ncbi:MAG TPA: TIGR03118 family protein [Bryobacteraceae bacterium]|nr:TIGR03118 family protein [Bryobacteraceae bacterium]
MTRHTLAAAMLSLVAVSAQTSTNNAYIQHNLVSDVPGLADVTDPNLVDPWGMSFSTTSPFWVTNHGKGNTTIYTNSNTTTGVAISSTVVTIPGAAGGTSPSPATGQVQNSTSGFLLANGTKASFIFCTEDGTVSAWNGGGAATVMIDNSAAGIVYKGMAIATNNGAPMLYMANFSYGVIDVLDTNFKLTTVPGGFGDPNMLPGFAPFNIWNVNNQLYVMYAKQDPTKKLDQPGVGNGVVNIFDLNGNLLQRLTSGGPLNSPWGVAVVGGGWGALSNSVLVGNFGDGKINAFDPKTGNLIGTMQDPSGKAISIQGLWAIEFGNGGSGGDARYLYFTAGIFNGTTTQHGLLGSLAPPAQVIGVQNAASGATGAIAPGEILALTGITIGPRPAVSSAVSPVGTSLGGTTVTINGTPAPILYTQADQTNIIVPWGATGTTASIVVTQGTTVSQTLSVPIAAAAPGLFTLSGGALAWNQDGTLNSATNAAPAGSVVVLYATGLGQTDPAGTDGAKYGNLVLAETVTPVTATVGGKAATVIYAGGAPGQVAGVMQVEVVVPTGAGTGAVPVVITSNGTTGAGTGGTSSGTSSVAASVYLK